jgi:hypothetical protein
MSRPASDSAQYKAFLFRLPPDLLAYIRDEAAASGRPLNTQVVWMLEHLRQHPVDLKPPRKQRERETAHA